MNIKPCPCCNRSIAIEFQETDREFYYRCMHCEIDWTPCKTEEEALKSWNTRPREVIDVDALLGIMQRVASEGYDDFLTACMDTALSLQVEEEFEDGEKRGFNPTAVN